MKILVTASCQSNACRERFKQGLVGVVACTKACYDANCKVTSSIPRHSIYRSWKRNCCDSLSVTLFPEIAVVVSWEYLLHNPYSRSMDFSNQAFLEVILFTALQFEPKCSVELKKNKVSQY